MKPSKITKTNDVGFDDVRQWFDQHMRVGKIDLDDQEVYKNVYHQAKWCGIFQCLDENTEILASDGTSKKIADVKIGDCVVSYDKNTNQFVNDEVINVYDNGIQDCIELTFENGTRITCTYDHLILTRNRGWVEAKDLDENDDIVDYKR